MLELRPIKMHNGLVCSGFKRLTFRKQTTTDFILGSRTHDGASMTEHEDQIAQYRLKLEETAALVARIRHEINNPLTGVLGQAQLLLREDLSERSRKRVQTIEDLALRLRDVVAQLREVQRPSSDGDGDQ
jgi:signal transduction histidine kinase